MLFDGAWVISVSNQVGLFKLGGEVFAYFLVDRTGRRPLFLASSTLVTVFLVILGEFTQIKRIRRLTQIIQSIRITQLIQFILQQ